MKFQNAPQIESPGNMMVRMAQLQAMQDASEEKQYAIAQRAAAQKWRQGLNALVEESKGEMTPKLLAHFVNAPDPAMQKFGLEGLTELKATNAFANFNAPPQEQPLFEARAPSKNFLGIQQGFDTPENKPLSVANELAPTRAASAFRPVSLDDKISMLEDRRDKLIAFANMYPRSTVGKNALEQAKLTDSQINNIRTSGRPLTVAPGGALVNPQGTQLFSAPPLPVAPTVTAVPGSGNARSRIAIAHPSRVGDPTRIEFQEMPEGVGARVQPPPPRTETIQDPITRRDMLVDVSAPGFNPELGSKTPGFLGFKGESPAQRKAREKEEKDEENKKSSMDALQGELDNQRFYYRELDRLEGITSIQRSGLKNLSAAAASSGVGQALGRTFGTEEQAYRDSIKSSKLRLLLALAKVTGQKSGQLNSNVELQKSLDALSDPSQGIEAAEENIANIEAFVQRSLSQPVTQEPKPASTEPPKSLGKPAAPKETSGRNMSSGPKVGTVADGYRFKGGDPSKKENWEKQ
jgi:hypothetical protein